MGIDGLSVLDVGACDGYYSFEAERRGARDVLALDELVWRNGAVNPKAFTRCYTCGCKAQLRAT
jgi:tRNA (mo5U34)-methyltransferase